MILLDSVNVVVKSFKSEEAIIKYLVNIGYDKEYVKKILKEIRPYDYGDNFTIKKYVKTFDEELKSLREIYIKIGLAIDKTRTNLSKELFYQTLSFNNRELEYKVEETLEKLAKIDDIMLVSNANPSMRYAINRLGINKYFKDILLSGEIQLNKPSNEIFEYIINKYNLKANECYFLDDEVENVIAARKNGMKSYLKIKNNSSRQIEFIEKYKNELVGVEFVKDIVEFYEKVSKDKKREK